jgi:hypothetical protein
LRRAGWVHVDVPVLPFSKEAMPIHTLSPTSGEPKGELGVGKVRILSGDGVELPIHLLPLYADVDLGTGAGEIISVHPGLGARRGLRAKFGEDGTLELPHGTYSVHTRQRWVSTYLGENPTFTVPGETVFRLPVHVRPYRIRVLDGGRQIRTYPSIVLSSGGAKQGLMNIAPHHEMIRFLPCGPLRVSVELGFGREPFVGHLDVKHGPEVEVLDLDIHL